MSPAFGSRYSRNESRRFPNFVSNFNSFNNTAGANTRSAVKLQFPLSLNYLLVLWCYFCISNFVFVLVVSA